MRAKITSRKKETFRLTERNYYSPDRPHLSVSQIKDYLKDPAFYKRRHIDHDPAVTFKVTGPIKRGSVVDDLLTRGSTEIQKRVLKKDDPALFEVQQGMDDRKLIEDRYWNEAMQIVGDFQKLPAWNENKDIAKFQTVLEGTVDGVPVCGLADRIDVLQSGVHRLIDVKVTSPVKIDSAKKWLWNAIEMGYHMQLGFYQWMYCQKLGIKHAYRDIVQCSNFVSAYAEPGLTKFGIYIFPQELLDIGLDLAIETIGKIKAKKFDPITVGWETAETLPFEVTARPANLMCFDDEEESTAV